MQHLPNNSIVFVKNYRHQLKLKQLFFCINLYSRADWNNNIDYNKSRYTDNFV